MTFDRIQTPQPPIDRSDGCANRAPIGAAPKEGAADATVPSAMGGVARIGGHAAAQETAAPPPVVTGEMLADELEAAALATGQTLHHFLAPIRFGLHGGRYVEQLRSAKRPKPRTIERIRAFLRGELAVEAEGVEYSGGTPGSLNNEYAGHRLNKLNQERERDCRRHEAAELGRALRQPGETLAEAVRREAEGIGEDRRTARKISATVHDPINLAKRIPHHPKARKFEPLPPEVWAG